MAVPVHYARILRVLGAASLAGLLAVAFTPLPNVLGRALGSASRLERADAIVALGSSVLPSGRLSSTSLRRAVDGIRLYRQGYAPLLVFSGSPPRDGRPAEGAVRTRLALELGVPAEAIVTVEAWTTRDEAARVAALLQARGVRRVLLVTESHHMVRARPLFERGGLEVLPAPTDTPWLAPNPEARLLLAWQLAGELFARLYYWLAGYR